MALADMMPALSGVNLSVVTPVPVRLTLFVSCLSTARPCAECMHPAALIKTALQVNLPCHLLAWHGVRTDCSSVAEDKGRHTPI